MILDFHRTNTGFLAWVLTILQSQLFHQSWQFQIHVKKWNCVISRIEHAQNYLGFQRSRFQFSLVSRLGRIEPDNSNGIAHGKFHCMKVWFSQRPWLSWLFFPAPENKDQYKLLDTDLMKIVQKKIRFCFNTSYLTDSYIVFTLKIESVCKITIFGLKMMVKSSIEKKNEIPPHHMVWRKITKSVTKITIFPHGGISK